MECQNTDAVLRALTPENRRLLSLIYRDKPDSIQSLSKIAGMAQSNVSRALSSLTRAGLVRLKGKKTKRPELVSSTIVINLERF